MVIPFLDSVLNSSPVRFSTSVRLDRPAPGLLRVRLDPLPVPVRVRVPDGARVVGAPGGGVHLTGGSWVDAPAGTREVSVRFTGDPQR